MVEQTAITKTLNCKHCGNTFAGRPSGKGLQPIYCSKECKKASWPTCSVEGCASKTRAKAATKCNPCYTHERKLAAGKCGIHKCHEPAVRVGAGLCEKHYYRIRRNGSPSTLPPKVSVVRDNGYRKVKVGKHPLSDRYGWVFEHRLVAYKHTNGRCDDCYWCGCSLDWSNCVIDHLDEDKLNNDIKNLVVTCRACNSNRGRMKPFIAGVMNNPSGSKLSELIATFPDMQAWSKEARAQAR